MKVYFIGGSLDGLTDDDASPPPQPLSVPTRAPGDGPVWELYTYCPADPVRNGRQGMRCVMYSTTRLT